MGYALYIPDIAIPPFILCFHFVCIFIFIFLSFSFHFHLHFFRFHFHFHFHFHFLLISCSFPSVITLVIGWCNRSRASNSAYKSMISFSMLKKQKQRCWVWEFIRSKKCKRKNEYVSESLWNHQICWICPWKRSKST